MLFIFRGIWEGLEIGECMDVFGDLEYLGRGYEKGGNVDVFGGMGCVGGEEKIFEVRGLICLGSR